jgi:hypothetical protein
MQSYWHTTLQRRITRRRALAAAGGLATAAAFLSACGGDDEEGGEEDQSGLVVKPQDETKGAKRGGVYKARNTFEPSTLDPHLFPNNFHVAATYSNLWMIKDGVLEYSDGTVEGDLVESWEVTPDKLTITAKINPKAHFAPVAPVNGRVVDAHDVAASWQRHSSTSNQRGDFANSVNPAAPISTITAVDDRTISIKLAAPNAVVMARLARATPGSLYIVPKEALDKNILDLARTSIWVKSRSSSEDARRTLGAQTFSITFGVTRSKTTGVPATSATMRSGPSPSLRRRTGTALPVLAPALRSERSAIPKPFRSRHASTERRGRVATLET